MARHLVMAGQLLDEDPAAALAHARAARRLGSRVGVVREASGLAAYHAGEWADALAELRAARRLRGQDDAYLPVMADCERGLGRPERALDLARSPGVERLDQAERVELRIVESGARRDLGQYDAAVVTLQLPELRDRRLRPWSARLFYAYADALTEAGRADEAVDWFARAAAADRDGETDAAERYAELEGLEIIDVEEADGPFEMTDEAAGASEVPGPPSSAAEAEPHGDEADPVQPPPVEEGRAGEPGTESAPAVPFGDVTGELREERPPAGGVPAVEFKEAGPPPAEDGAEDGAEDAAEKTDEGPHA
ncbi:ICP22 family protein [Actinomadura craniellae]|uniref:hypothetical protein n=1 Tax=Actinomadura craniellae TaxID=2231787 RepID=UPI001F27DCD5|nr:hypothetical protein [Actinomadura craniellae]